MSVHWRKYSSLRMPGRAGRAARACPAGRCRAGSCSALSWLCVYSRSPKPVRARSPRMFHRSQASVPVGLEAAVRRVVAGPDVVLADGGGRVAVVVERGQRRLGDGARDRAVAAVGLEAGVVERGADLLRRDLPAEDRRALVVAGELHGPVADLGELVEALDEPVRDPFRASGRGRRRRDPVADAEQDDAAPARGNPRRAGERIGRDLRKRRGSRRGTRGRGRCAEELLSAQSLCLSFHVLLLLP